MESYCNITIFIVCEYLFPTLGFLVLGHIMIVLTPGGVFGSANNATCILRRGFCTLVLFIIILSFIHTLSTPGSPEGVLVGVSETGSVRVSWEAVENADYYTVSFSQAVGDDQEGLCRDDSHSAHVTVHDPTASIAVRDDVGSDETHIILRAYTTYSVSVVAFSDVWGRTVGSEAVNVTTPQKS